MKPRQPRRIASAPYGANARTMSELPGVALHERVRSVTTIWRSPPMAPAHVLGLRCRDCGREFELAPVHYCDWCFGGLEVAYDYDWLRGHLDRDVVAAGPPTIWRYAGLLPADAPEAHVVLPTGVTPLVRADRLAAELGLRELWIKDDTRNPTNSF